MLGHLMSMLEMNESMDEGVDAEQCGDCPSEAMLTCFESATRQPLGAFLSVITANPMAQRQ